MGVLKLFARLPRMQFQQQLQCLLIAHAFYTHDITEATEQGLSAAFRMEEDIMVNDNISRREFLERSISAGAALPLADSCVAPLKMPRSYPSSVSQVGVTE